MILIIVLLLYIDFKLKKFNFLENFTKKYEDDGNYKVAVTSTRQAISLLLYN